MKLNITFSNIKKAEGKLFVALFKKGIGYPDKHELASTWEVLDVNMPETVWTVEVDEESDYAVTVYHDVNNNGRLDKNWMGVPTEPMGFSNDVRPVFSAPSYLSASFVPKNVPNGITIRLFTM